MVWTGQQYCDQLKRQQLDSGSDGAVQGEGIGDVKALVRWLEREAPVNTCRLFSCQLGVESPKAGTSYAARLVLA